MERKTHLSRNVIKTAIILIILVLGGCCLNKALAQVPLFTQMEGSYTYAGVFVDPTFTDQGYQIGFELGKSWQWGYAQAEISRYENHKGDVGYWDLIGTFGGNFHFRNYDNIRYYAGLRGGAIIRTQRQPTFRRIPFGMVGIIGGFDIRLTRWTSDHHVWIGPRLWIDYREGQKNEFFGDSDAYKPGLITNNPLLQENGAVRVVITW